MPAVGTRSAQPSGRLAANQARSSARKAASSGVSRKSTLARYPCASGARSGDVLDVQVLVDPLGAALAPEARLLDAAEGRGGVRDEPAVEAEHAGLERLDDLQA